MLTPVQSPAARPTSPLALALASGLAGAAMNPPPANFTDPVFWESRDLERIVTVIRDGAAAVGGSPLMLPWSSLYDEDQIRQLAAYVMAFRPDASQGPENE